MKKISKKVFFIALIFAIISIITVNIEFNSQIKKMESINERLKGTIENSVEGGNVEDVEGNAAIISGTFLGISFIGIVMCRIIQIALTMMVIGYMILYLISWLINRKKENKGNIIVSCILNIVAIIVKIKFINIVIGTFANDGIQNIEMLLGVSILSEIISMMIIIIYYIVNRNEIIKMYKGEGEIE